MSKLKQFFKKYWLWLLVGALIAIIILVIFLLSRQEDEKEVEVNILLEKIVSPYVKTEHSVDIDLNVPVENLDEREWVYSVSRPEGRMFTNFVKNFYEVKKEINLEEEIIMAIGDDMVWYNADIGVLSIFSKGLVLDLKITTKRDVSSFFFQYFGIQNSENEKVEQTEKGTLYLGHFFYNEMKIGSSHLGGYSYRLELDKNGKLLEFSMLLLKEENLQKYQYMPTVSLEELLLINNYPMKIVNNKIEERFYEQSELLRASSKLNNLTAKSVDALFLLNDFEDKYLLPSYKVAGDGEILDSKGGKYWSTTDIFFCGIDPEYLLEKPIEDYREKPHSDPSS